MSKKMQPKIDPQIMAAELERADRRRVFVAFGWITLLALVMRAIHLVQARDVPLFDILIVDGRQYDAWARRIAAGDWMGSETFYQAPLYPYFLAVLKTVFGDGLWPIRIVQALLGATSCGLLFLAARNFVSHKVGVVAGVILAIYPPAVFFDGLVQKAAIGGFIVVLLLWLISRVQRTPTALRFLSLGAALGALLLTREETILLFPALLLWVLWRFREHAWKLRGAWVASLAAGAALLLLPIGWLNHHVGGEFLITTSQAGSNFWIGNRPGAEGIYAPLRPGRSDTSLERGDAFELAEIEMGRKLTPREVSKFWFDRAFAWIGDEPVAWLKLLGLKAALLVNWFEVPDAEDQYFYEKHEPFQGFVSRFIHLGIILPLCAAGLVLGWPRRRDLGVLALLLAVLCTGVVMFYVMGRYRYPIVPIVIVFAALALVQGFALARVGAWKTLIPAVAALFVAAVCSNWTIHARDSQISMSHVNAGAALASMDRLDEAKVQYEESLKLDPNAPEAWANLGALHGRLGQMDRTIECFENALKLRPDDPRFHMSLGTAYYMNRDATRAVAELARSIELYPQDPEAWNNLRYIFVAAKEWARAVDIARGGAAANPEDVGLGISLAWLLAVVPDEKVAAPLEALAIAQRWAKRTAGTNSAVIDALAAALARTGRYDEARVEALEALAIAERSGQRDSVAGIRARIELYTQKKPYIESSK
ncbi:MAG: tetratricopeptide repeat protein [Planctomycetota bacterium]|nr:tetratricopeptide repeat protein [Planctomycetota bacterium]